MSRPRVLLVPDMSELEWPVKPLIEQWAEVASYDVPGVGAEPPVEGPRLQAAVNRGLEEIDRRGWDRCFVAGDEVGVPTAVLIAAARPDLVQGLALGHACLSLRTTGHRPPVLAETSAALLRLAELDYRMYARHLTQATQGAYDEEMTDEYIRRVPQEVAVSSLAGALVEDPVDVEDEFRALEVPLLLVEHQGCLMWTKEGYEDTVAAAPGARTASMDLKPSANPEFVELLRAFCEERGRVASV